MPVAAPQRNTPQLVKEPLQFVVLLGPEDGSAPTLEDEVDYLDVQSIGLYAGGSRQNSISLRWNFAKLETHIQDTTAPVNYGRQVEVRILDEDGEPTIIAAWGFIAAPKMRVGDAEELQLLVRIEPWHFGEPLIDHRYCKEPVDPDDDEEEPVFLSVQRPCIVNPELDGVVIGNRSLKREPAEEEDEAAETDRPYVFLHPDQVKTLQAQLTQGHVGEPPKWTPSQIVHWLCRHVNPDETYLKNPTLDELREAFGAPPLGEDGQEPDDPEDEDEENLDTVDQLKNVALPYGKYLSELLDILLRPLGMGWHLAFALNDDDERETRLVFYRRGHGDLVKLRMQRFEKPLDLKHSDLPRATIDISIVDLANRIICRGRPKRYETTMPLYPGWKESDDDVVFAKTEHDRDTILSKPYVGRKYVLNEAGDYPNVARDDLETTEGEAAAKEFAAAIRSTVREVIGENSLVIRRRFWPCLTTKQPPEEMDGQPEEEQRSIGYWVEWWDRNHVEPANIDADLPEMPAVTPTDPADPGWRRVVGQFSVLDHECGILFERPHGQLWQRHQENVNPPAEWDPESGSYQESHVPEHPGLFLRITACIDADERLEYIAERRDSSPNAQDVALFLDLPDKFHSREVHETSIFYYEPGETNPDGTLKDFAADEIDDSDKIEAYAKKIRGTEDCAEVSCSIVLPGCDYADLAIGKLIKEFNGRNISLDANQPADADVEPRRLQIVGFNVTCNPKQETELLVETFSEERPA